MRGSPAERGGGVNVSTHARLRWFHRAWYRGSESSPRASVAVTDVHPPVPATRARDRFLAVLAGAYCLIAAFPDVLNMMPGLDGSWRIELGRLHVEKLFGRDAAFTYGPLGYLLSPTDVLGEVVGAALLRLAHQVGMAGLVTYLVLRRQRLRALALVASQLAALAIGLGFDYQLLLLLPVLALRGPWLLVAFAMAGALLFTKTSIGIAALGTCASAAVVQVAGHRVAGGRALAASAAVYVATIVALGAALLHAPGELWEWLRISAQLADGYSAAMGSSGPPGRVALGVVVLAAFAIVTGWLLWRRSRAGWIALAFAVPIFVAFKHAYVREDAGHEVSFLPLVVAVVGVVMLGARQRREFVGAGAVAVMALSGASPLMRISGTASAGDVWRLTRGARGFANLERWMSFEDETQRWRRGIEAAIAPDRIPGLHERVAGRTVGVIPWELAYCRANELRCVANPTLQLYSAYTADLDLRTAEHYAGRGAPALVIAEDEAIDGRSALLDTPATLRALIAHYEVLPGEPAPGRVLLGRRRVPLRLEPTFVGTAVEPPGGWIAAPRVQGRLLIFPNFRLSIRGMVEKALFKVGAVNLDVVYCDGRTASYRVIADTARNGLLLAGMVEGERGVSRAWEPAEGPEVARVRFSGPGMRAYRQPLPVRWAEVPGGRREDDRCSPHGPAPAALARRWAPPHAPLMAVDEFGLEWEQGQPDRLHVQGWAVDPVSGLTAAGVLVEVAGRSTWLPTGRSRSDVAEYFHDRAYERAGYGGFVDVSGLPPGQHEVAIKVVSSDRRGYFESTFRAAVPASASERPGQYGDAFLAAAVGIAAAVALVLSAVVRWLGARRRRVARATP